MNKSKHITFRMTEQEYQDIMAAKGDMSMSDYIRICFKLCELYIAAPDFTEEQTKELKLLTRRINHENL